MQLRELRSGSRPYKPRCLECEDGVMGQGSLGMVQRICKIQCPVGASGCIMVHLASM